MLQREPRKRASLEEIEDHPWLQGVDPSPAKKLSLPLTSYKSLSEEEHKIIIQAMECGNIAPRELIQEALEADKYNHITASYFLLAERILREKQEKQTQSRSLNLDYNWPSHVPCRSSLSATDGSFGDATDGSTLSETHNGFSLKHSADAKGPAKKVADKTEGRSAKDIVKLASSADAEDGPSPMRILLRSSLEASVMPKNVSALQQISEEDEEEEEEEEVVRVEVKAALRPSVREAPCGGLTREDDGANLGLPAKDKKPGAGSGVGSDDSRLLREVWSCQRATEVSSSTVEVRASAAGPLCCSRWAGKSEPLPHYFGNRPINLMNESNNNSTTTSGSKGPPLLLQVSDISVEKPPPCPHTRPCPDGRVTLPTQRNPDLQRPLSKCEGPRAQSPKHLIDQIAENSGLSNDSACSDSTADPVNKHDTARSKNVNIRDRILQIPLCEKALSFKIKPNSKENLLSFGQFNCCHVI